MDKSIDSFDQQINPEFKKDLDKSLSLNSVEVQNIDPEDSSDGSSPEVELNDVTIDKVQNETSEVSQIDFKANMEEFLEPSPEGFSAMVGYNTFEIEDLSALLIERERFKGPSFIIGDYVFNLILVCQKRSHLFFSIYLEGHPINEKEGDIWSFPVQFAFDAWDPENPLVHKQNSTRFRYNQRVTDWGFVQFLDSKGAIESQFFRKNKVNITVYARIIDDYTHVLYSDFRDYDSKKFTGYVGIENQGATCYLNSLLQSYFFTKSFRKKVYQIPTEDEINFDFESYQEYQKQPKTVSLALQRIFYKLQTSNVAINSLELTHSFGWTTADAFTQHDVQELNRILMDRLENKMKGTDIDGCLNNIFVGKMNSFIRCINVDYESSRTEDFWDIQLNVKGLKNIKESFENYVELEILDGDNKYDASGFGLQDAEKGVNFESFPDVLHVQLKRYEYDFETDNMVKIHDRYEFFDEIDLKPYISKNAEHYDEDWEYQLHGVLVHQGDVSVGHYYAMIRPKDEDKWFKFDDDRVSRVTPQTVFQEGFGCGPPMNFNKSMSRDEYQNYIIRHHTSAYMLVYIRKSKVDDVLAEVEDCDVPSHITKQIEYENAEEMRIKKEREEMHLYVNFKVFTDSTFSKYQGFDLGPNSDDRHYFADGLYDPESFPITFRLLKTAKWNSIYDTLAQLLGMDESHTNMLRIWNIVKRTNNTFRPDRPVDTFVEDIEELTVGDISTILENGVSRRKYSGSDRPIVLSLYLEDASRDLKYLANHLNQITTGDDNDSYEEKFNELVTLTARNSDASLEPIVDSTNILLFIKYFSYENQSLKGLSHIILPHDATTEFLAKTLQSIFNFHSDNSLLFSEELDFNKRLEVKPDQSLYQSELGNGDIICVSNKNYSIDKSLSCQNFEEFYVFMESRVHFQFSQLKRIDEDEEDYVFVEKTQEVGNYDKEIDVWLSYYSTYLDLATVIGREISVPPEYIKLSIISNDNKIDLKSDYDFEKALSNTLKKYVVRLYYEVMKIPVQEFEGMELCHVYWVGNGICKEERHDFFLPRSSTIDQLVTKLQSKVEIDPAVRDSLFGWIPSPKRKIERCVSLDDNIGKNTHLVIGIFPQYGELYFSKITNKDIILISGFQFYASVDNTHGLPFVFDLFNHETFPATMERLRKLLGLSEKEFKCARIGVTTHGGVEYIDPIENTNTELFSYFSKVNHHGYCLVIDHPDRKSRRASQHSSIMIKN